MGSDFAAFLARRAVAALIFVFAVTSAAVIIARLAPGDGINTLGQTAEFVAAERARLGLDRPLHEFYGSWVAGLARFDLGRTRAGQSVATLVFDAAKHTALLAVVALMIATAIGLPLGIATGARPHGWLATVTMPISVALLACPPLVGALALLLLAIYTGWLSTSPGSLALPAIALSLPLAAMLERLQAQATSDALAAPEHLAAAARGLSPRRLLWIHAARQSLAPVLGVYGIIIGSLFSGSLAVEIITSWPGLGRLMFGALGSRDTYLVAGGALVGATMIAIANVAADVLRGLADPRVSRTP